MAAPSGSHDPAAAKRLWREARTVCFDVDSTVSPDEAIDVLAAFAGVGAQVAALTRAAMGGTQTFQESLAARLALIRPTSALVADCLRAHPPRLTPGIAGLIGHLHAQGAAVHLVSGGFEPFILPLAAQLGIDPGRVHANRFMPMADGLLAADPERPTCRSGGKAEAVRRIIAAGAAGPVAMVGDGITDIEARPPADVAIGFGGIIARPAVRERADWFVLDPAELLRHR